MRGTDKVHIGTFEEDHIEAVQFGSRRAAECRVDIMPAGSAQLHRHAVHQHAVFLYLHVTETDTAVETTDLLSVLAEGYGQRIDVRHPTSKGSSQAVHSCSRPLLGGTGIAPTDSVCRTGRPAYRRLPHLRQPGCCSRSSGRHPRKQHPDVSRRRSHTSRFRVMRTRLHLSLIHI